MIRLTDSLLVFLITCLLMFVIEDVAKESTDYCIFILKFLEVNVWKLVVVCWSPITSCKGTSKGICTCFGGSVRMYLQGWFIEMCFAVFIHGYLYWESRMRFWSKFDGYTFVWSINLNFEFLSKKMSFLWMKELSFLFEVYGLFSLGWPSLLLPGINLSY